MKHGKEKISAQTIFAAGRLKIVSGRCVIQSHQFSFSAVAAVLGKNSLPGRRRERAQTKSE